MMRDLNMRLDMSCKMEGRSYNLQDVVGAQQTGQRRGVVVLGFYVSPTAKVIRRRDLGLKSHPKDWRSPESNSRPLD